MRFGIVAAAKASDVAKSYVPMMHWENQQERSSSVQQPILLFGLFASALTILTIYAFSRPLQDFAVYWTAAHLLIGHQNPYSLNEVFRFQQSLGLRQSVPLPALSPPWTLTFLAPIGLVKSYSLAWLGWVGVLTCALAVSSRMLMDLYFGQLNIREISDRPVYRSLFAFTFYPVLLSLKFAQIVPLVLLGIAGFLWFDRKRQPILAGALFSLTAVKPNLVYLVWITLFLRAFDERRFKTLLAMACVIALLTGTALTLDPQAFVQYRALVSTPLVRLLLPGMAGAIRSSLGPRDTFWVQFVPPLFGILWLAIYWRKHRQNWDWAERMPALITASLITTSYAYLFDQNLLSVPIIALAAMHARQLGRIPVRLVVCYTALNGLLILMAMLSSPWSFVPALLVIAFLLYRSALTGKMLTSSAKCSYLGSEA